MENELDPVRAHTARITHMLEQPNVTQAEQRLYRTRYRVGEFVVASIVQRFSNQNHAAIGISIYVTRGFERAELHLNGKYSMDEVVAFLRLDCVDPDTITWVDETPTNIVVPSTVPAILEKFNS